MSTEKEGLTKCGRCKFLRHGIRKLHDNTDGFRPYCLKGKWEGFAPGWETSPYNPVWDDCKDFISVDLVEEVDSSKLNKIV